MVKLKPGLKGGLSLRGQLPAILTAGVCKLRPVGQIWTPVRLGMVRKLIIVSIIFKYQKQTHNDLPFTRTAAEFCLLVHKA